MGFEFAAVEPHHLTVEARFEADVHDVGEPEIDEGTEMSRRLFGTIVEFLDEHPDLLEQFFGRDYVYTESPYWVEDNIIYFDMGKKSYGDEKFRELLKQAFERMANANGYSLSIKDSLTERFVHFKFCKSSDSQKRFSGLTEDPLGINHTPITGRGNCGR
jgi:hypothetical protein